MTVPKNSDPTTPDERVVHCAPISDHEMIVVTTQNVLRYNHTEAGWVPEVITSHDPQFDVQDKAFQGRVAVIDSDRIALVRNKNEAMNFHELLEVWTKIEGKWQSEIIWTSELNDRGEPAETIQDIVTMPDGRIAMVSSLSKIRLFGDPTNL